MDDINDIWYDNHKALYEDFVARMEDLLKSLLQEEMIPYHSVTGRLKAKDSFLEKIERKNYTSINQMTDLSGLRIIAYTTLEVDQICHLIEKEFLVDSEKSVNKADAMEINKVGYLSVHYIIALSPERISLSEYKRFNGLWCEIQVRSLLQHAWAEIEHDRNYKFTGILPDQIKREFYLIAGALELIDQEFSTLSNRIDEYVLQIQEKTQKGNYNIPIDSTSLLEFLNEYFHNQNHEKPTLLRLFKERSDEIIQELNDYGVLELYSLKKLLDKKTIESWLSDNKNYISILRDSMIYDNPIHYFLYAWNEHWIGISDFTVKKWAENGISIDDLRQIINIEETPNSYCAYRLSKKN